MNTHKNSYVVNYGDFRMQDWLLNADLSVGPKLTYSLLASLAGGKDHAWPSQNYLASKMSVSTRTVQRYLQKLVDSGLIEKCRGYLQGKVRCFYKFLAAKLVPVTPTLPLKEQHDNLSPCPDKAPEVVASNTTICRVVYDNLSPSLNKEETIKGKEEILPPTPQEVEPAFQVEPIQGLAGGERVEILELEEKSLTPQIEGTNPGTETSLEPEWIVARESLKAELSGSHFETWINPVLFEKAEGGAILRCQNDFTKNWVQKNFGQKLAEALSLAGIKSFHLELMTEEQLAMQKENLESNRTNTEKATQITPKPEVDPDTLATREQFEKLYDVYPRKERFGKGLEAFVSLQDKSLPQVSALIVAVKRQKQGKESWQRNGGRWIPQLHRWLLESGWLD